MENIEKYYENTKNAMPHKNVERFIKHEPIIGKAIDLGCGAGRDTVFLIKNNWNVTAIDKENTKQIIEQKLTDIEKNRFKFKCQNFEDIRMEKNDLVISNYSIPFCNKKYFKTFWKKVVDSISDGRIFHRKFLWVK